MILPKIGPSLFIGVEEITTQTIDMLYRGAISDEFRDHSHCVSLLPFYVYHNYSSPDFPWIKKLFDNVYGRLPSISIDTRIVLGRLGIYASNDCESISRNARHFDCEKHDKIYIGFLCETARLIRAEIDTTYFRGESAVSFTESSEKGAYLGGKLYCDTYMKIDGSLSSSTGKAIPIDDDSEEITSTSSEEESGAAMPYLSSVVTDISSVEGTFAQAKNQDCDTKDDFAFLF